VWFIESCENSNGPSHSIKSGVFLYKCPDISFESPLLHAVIREDGFWIYLRYWNNTGLSVNTKVNIQIIFSVLYRYISVVIVIRLRNETHGFVSVHGQGFVHTGTGASFPAVKRLGCEAVHSLLSSAKVKNTWRYTSTPYMHMCLAWCLRKAMLCLYVFTYVHTYINA
jgi:hypothetical protein